MEVDLKVILTMVTMVVGATVWLVRLESKATALEKIVYGEQGLLKQMKELRDLITQMNTTLTKIETGFSFLLQEHKDRRCDHEKTN